jgi:hypothetical protein
MVLTGLDNAKRRRPSGPYLAGADIEKRDERRKAIGWRGTPAKE